MQFLWRPRDRIIDFLIILNFIFYIFLRRKFAVVVTGQYHEMEKFLMDTFHNHLVCNI